jgi:D-beta-D-heptose 7-phosphate kinase/D-beta-D-heptose 1-phosphate adenosyltransferase
MTMKPDLISLVQSLSKAKVLCVGDIMLDRFVTGSVDRISPEAPIPVLSVHNENIMLGGAGNVVRNLAALGAHIKMVSLIGDDDAGTEIQGLLNKLDRVDAHLVIDTNRQSSIKTRYLAGTQQMMRADQETIAPLDDKTRKDVVKTVTEALKEYAVLVLSDYGKGVLLDGMAKTLIDAAKKAGVAPRALITRIMPAPVSLRRTAKSCMTPAKSPSIHSRR